MARPIKRQFNAGGLLLAAIAATPISFWLLMVIAFVGSVVGTSPLRSIEVGPVIGGIIFLTVLVTAWGAIPAGAFGALGLWLFEALRAGRNPPRWLFAAAGAGAASMYAIVGLAVTQLSGPVGMMMAPWASLMRRDQAERLATMQGTILIVGCIIAAGGIAGLIYERSSRGSPRETVRPALFLSDDERG